MSTSPLGRVRITARVSASAQETLEAAANTVGATVNFNRRFARPSGLSSLRG